MTGVHVQLIHCHHNGVDYPSDGGEIPGSVRVTKNEFSRTFFNLDYPVIRSCPKIAVMHDLRHR